MNYTHRGRQGEEYIEHELRERGHNAYRLAGNNRSDLSIGDAIAEIKSAYPSAPNRWQFSFRRHREQINDEDLFFLVCYASDDSVIAVYVIPGGAVPDHLTKIDITSHPDKYRGKWAVYRDSWELVHPIVDAATPETYFDEPIPF